MAVGFLSKQVKWLCLLLLCFVCGTCTKKAFEKITFYGYLHDIDTRKPFANAKVLINTCCGGFSKAGCSSCLVAVAFTNEDGYYEITTNASRSKRYFFVFDSETFSTVDRDPRNTEYERVDTSTGGVFRNDFVIGNVSYWHKVHVKNINPFDAKDRLILHMPVTPEGRFDTLAFGGAADTTVVIRFKYRRCCTADPAFESNFYNYQVVKNNNMSFFNVDQPIKPRDTTFYDILY